jgi:uncharacterized lipoprotein YajG
MRFTLLPCLLAAFLALAACGGKPTPVFLAPTPEVRTGDIGARQTVLVTVTDLRGTEAVGRRTSVTGKQEDIKSLQPVEDVLRTQIERALTARGFVPVKTPESGTRRLDVTLERFSYDTKSSVVSSTVTVDTAMTVAAQVEGRTSTHTYSSRGTETVALGPSETTRDRAVNSALTELLDKVIGDDALFETLAGR